MSIEWSDHTDERPCVMCKTLTTSRYGRRKTSGAWDWRSPRCPDVDACHERRMATKVRAA